MISLLQSIVNTIISLVSFVISAITSLVALLMRIPTFVSILVSSIGFMPTVWMPISLVTISISVILMVVGRQS